MKLFLISALTILAGMVTSGYAHPYHICSGDTKLPINVQSSMIAVDDPAAVNAALGEPLKGQLCQGQAYRVIHPLTIYRTWNSNNPDSAQGKWWSFSKPEGNVQQYRSNVELCPAWSPIDKLEVCMIDEGAELVVGTGQSAQCDQYLTYPQSAVKQIFLSEKNKNKLSHCYVESASLDWHKDTQPSKYHLTFTAGHAELVGQVCGSYFDIASDANVVYFNFPLEGNCHISVTNNQSRENVQFDLSPDFMKSNCHIDNKCQQVYPDKHTFSVDFPDF